VSLRSRGVEADAECCFTPGSQQRAIEEQRMVKRRAGEKNERVVKSPESREEAKFCGMRLTPELMRDFSLIFVCVGYLKRSNIFYAGYLR
jgi:hypothetical protein